METLRQTMIPSKIIDIINGKFVRKEGLEPSYILTDTGQRISRVNLLGTIIDKFMREDGNYSSITIDDDSGSIRVKAFREDTDIFEDLNVGDLVMVIGKVREYSDENYVIPEIVKRVADPNYESLHKLEVLKNILRHEKVLEKIKKEMDKFSDMDELKKYMKKEQDLDDELIEGIVETLTGEKEVKEKDYKPLVLETLDRLDEGEGVEFKKLLKESKLPENTFEEVINELLSDGICFEPKPGVLKKV